MKTFAIFCISASLSFGGYCQGPPPPPPPGPGPSSSKPSAPTEDDMMMPPPPQPDKTEEASFVEKYQLKTIESGGLVKHSNIFFSMSFKAKEKLTRLSNSYIFRSFNEQEEVSLWSLYKSHFTHAEGKDELAHLRITPQFDKWNLEKMGEYFFVNEDPYKSTFPINRNMKNLTLMSKKKVVIDGTEFLKLEFKNKDPKNGFIEIKYLTTLGDFIYVINHRKKATDPEDVMKNFRMNK